MVFLVYYYDLTELIDVLEDEGYLVYDSVEKFVEDYLKEVIDYLVKNHYDVLVRRLCEEKN